MHDDSYAERSHTASPHPARNRVVPSIARRARLFCMVATCCISGGALRVGADEIQSLDVPLTLREVAGAERRQDPCSTGVPLPQGLLMDTSPLQVTDEAGAPVPAQFRVLERWRNHGEDGSIKWLLVTFLADVPAAGQAIYRLRRGVNPLPPVPARPSEGLGPFRLLLTNADGKSFTDADVKEVTREVVETGPVRACVKLESPSSHDTFGFIAWVYTYAGSDRTDLTVVLKNTPNERVGPFYLRDFSVAVETAGKTFMLGGDPGKTFSGVLDNKPVYLYQASCGTDKWQTFGTERDYGSALVMDWSADKAIAKAGLCGFRGWRVMQGDEKMDEGFYALGWGGISDQSRTALLLTRHFRENYPSAIEAQPGRLVSRLLPQYYTGYQGLHWLDDSTRKRFDLSFQRHDGLDAARADGLAESFNKPLIAHCGPAWLNATGMFGRIAGGQAGDAAKPKSWPHSYGYASRFAPNWIVFGGYTQDRIRRRYHEASMGGFIRSGNPWDAYALMIQTAHTSGLTPLWLDDYQFPRDKLNVRHYLGTARDPGKYRSGTRHHGWRTWNMSHFKCQEFFDSWRLFGDPLALKAAHDAGTYAHAHVGYRQQGGGLVAGTRADGNPFYNLAEAWRVTQRPDLLDALHAMAQVSWNQVNKSRGNYGVMNSWEGGKENVEKPFMMDHVLAGLHEHWKLSGDSRTRDQMLGMVDFILDEALLVDPEDGATYGYLYVVKLDEPQEKALSQRMGAVSGIKKSPGGFRMHLQPSRLIFAYGQTGEPRYRDVLQRMMPAVYRAHGNNRRNYEWLATWLQTTADKAFNPPPPIADLKATAMEGARVRLEWTTPNGATRLEIKGADKPMAERIWPDKVETHVNWWAAEHVKGVPEPKPGERAEMIVDGLEPGTHVFSARGFNADNQRSALGAMAMVTVE